MEDIEKLREKIDLDKIKKEMIEDTPLKDNTPKKKNKRKKPGIFVYGIDDEMVERIEKTTGMSFSAFARFSMKIMLEKIEKGQI